ncbi:hypothetical protein G6F66_005856 [Rhizopus arrhizus]|nr:hypothetical protein G6F66_005856 [Rhizopus arrhizus]
MSEGLTQDDFRRLMATPRQPNPTDETTHPSHPKTPKSTGAVFAKPHSLRRKVFHKKNDKPEPPEHVSHYRDRAAERRQQEQDEDGEETQLTTEELLKRTQREVDEGLSTGEVYEQSKYLGGDVDHTHLVKGLDFALLNRVRREMEESPREEEEKEEKVPIEVMMESKPTFSSVMAKNIYNQIMNQDKDSYQRVELFEPGRMSFVFELADEIGHYSDAFAVPTAVIKSKAEAEAKSSELFAETDLVIEKISKVMTTVRYGDQTRKPERMVQRTRAELTSEPVAMMEDGFSGDIFAGVGRDYELDESALESYHKRAEDTTAKTTENKKSYFEGIREEEEEDEVMPDAKETVASILSQAKEEEPKKKKRKREDEMMVDDDAADIDMFGLGTSALPTSFDERSMVAYEEGEEEEEEEGESKTRLIDHGTNRNKKAQLTRWDFETDEEWQKYKDSIEILPKSAIQFGVKMNDGRKRNKEKKSLTDKQRLDRDYRQVKNIMSQKYGQSLDK